ncbi:prolyl oligopeptidase family serine peptidase [Nannocystaceae bacterium ST9]
MSPRRTSSFVVSSSLLAVLSLNPACKREETQNPDVAPTDDSKKNETATASRYPVARIADQIDDYHGTKVADPYRWLEDLDSDETRAWVEAENEVTFEYLESIEARAKIRAHLEKLWNVERWGTPSEYGGRYFFSKNDGLQNQSVLYWSDKLEGEPKLLLDPNTLSADGTTAVSATAISDDGKLMAYALADAGSDWNRWQVLEVATGKVLPDLIEWSKFTGVAWNHANTGFFYGAYDAPKQGDEYEGVNLNQKLFFHALGDAQAKDTLIYADPEHPEWQFSGLVSEDGKYLIIDVSVGTDVRNMMYYAPLDKSGKPGEVVELLPELEATYSFLGNRGGKFLVFTNLDAPRGRVVEIDTKQPDKAKWKEVIPQTENTLQGVSFVGDKLFANYLVDAKSRIDVFSSKGKLEKTLELPEPIATVYGFGGKQKAKQTFYGLMSFTRPYTIYRYDIAKGTSELWKTPPVAFDPERYTTSQVFYESKDGTKVPMFLVHRKDITPTGDLPTYLYGYGGFNISLTPRFSPADLVWLELGGVLAQPSLRGGGEYGEAWHDAGTKLQKQNVFDDFIAAAEWLIAQGYTKPDKLVIGGRSNGGLLVGAAMTQRPDLFGVVLAGVGVMDMLRFHKFTIGWAWASDYGNSDDPSQFKALYAYSPYHNLEDGTEYPATLVYTADHDDRVVPSHSFKFAARLQAAHRGDNPVMIRIETKAGHGAGKPTSKQIDEAADLWSFAFDQLGMQLPEGF